MYSNSIVEKEKIEKILEFGCPICEKRFETNKGLGCHFNKHKKHIEYIDKKCESKKCKNTFKAKQIKYDDYVRCEERFCSKKCSRSFSSYEKREEINRKVSERFKKTRIRKIKKCCK